MFYPTLSGTSGRLLWWFAVELDDDPSRLSRADHRLAPSPFKHFEEVIEHERVMLHAEIAEDAKIILPAGIIPLVGTSPLAASPSFLSGPATLDLSDERIFATLENGEYYELTLPAWVGGRTFRPVEVKPTSVIYEVELKSPRYAETDTLVVIDGAVQDDPSPIPGRTFYRLTSSPWA